MAKTTQIKTIGNPLSWIAGTLTGAGSMIAKGTDAIGSHDISLPEVQRLTTADLRGALRDGLDDFLHFRTDVMMMAVIYPLIGLMLSFLAFQQEMFALLFPLAAGFALVGPLAATGLYEMSRRREAGEEASWLHAFQLLRSPTFAPVMTLGLYLIAIYAVWLYAAAFIYRVTLGTLAPEGMMSFASMLFSTSEGWAMIVIGNAIGFLFALTVLVTGFIAFPMLVDRRVGLPVAVTTSIRVAQQNKRITLGWGAIVATFLLIGALPLFLGMIFVLPILGHGTWHLYRRAVRFPDS